MLELINEERVRAGLDHVAMAENVAAQLHAESSLEDCTSSHWGGDGLKPNMRYSLAGGYQANGENGQGLDYCITSADGYQAIANIKHEIDEAMNGWMQSAGHRDNILDPWHRKVNIGLAWDNYNFVAFQHFEGDYIEYERLPTLTGNNLTFVARVKNGVTLSDEWDLAVQIYYDPPPETLTNGQLARTYCYDSGLKVASLRPPAGGGSYKEHSYQSTYDPCPNPYDVPAGATPARSLDEAHALWQEAYDASQRSSTKRITVPWITANRMSVSGDKVEVRASLREVLAEHGAGVYSIIMWDGLDMVISEYSIFHDVTPPDTYDVD